MSCLVLSLLLSPFASAVTRKGSASLVVPIAGSGPGAFGTYWRTDLNVINHRDLSQAVTISMNEADLFEYGPEYSTEIVLPPNSTTTYLDVVSTLFGRATTGVIYINTGVEGAPVDPDAELDVTYRIWTPQTDGAGTSSESSIALDFSLLPRTSDPTMIIGVKQDADFRCSVGVVNIGYSERQFRATASSATGSVTMTFTVPGYSVNQVPLPAANLGYMTVVVEPLDGNLTPWTAFASSVDNHSGDAWLVNGAARKGATSLLIPIAGSGQGAFGTFWRTDLSLVNHRDVPQEVTLAFADVSSADQPEVDVVLPPSSTTTYVDVVSSLFGLHVTGVIYINPVFHFNSYSGDADLDATYRTWTARPGQTGTVSQSSTSLDLFALPGSTGPLTIAGVRHDADFRSSVGVVNVTNFDRSFRVTATSTEGRSVTMTYAVTAYTVNQVPIPAADLGYTTIVVEPLDESSAPWTAFASSVDNKSGDSWLVNAVPQ
jgi:hypothetical protein